MGSRCGNEHKGDAALVRHRGEEPFEGFQSTGRRDDSGDKGTRRRGTLNRAASSGLWRFWGTTSAGTSARLPPVDAVDGEGFLPFVAPAELSAFFDLRLVAIAVLACRGGKNAWDEVEPRKASIPVPIRGWEERKM